MGDADFQDWINLAKDADILGIATSLGARLRKNGADHTGPCPAGCAKTDGFIVTPGKSIFLCRPSGATGSGIDMVMHVNGGDFVSACEFINGSPPPREAGGESAEDRSARLERAAAAAKERRDERRDADIIQLAKDNADAAKKKSAAVRLWEAGFAFAGSHADAYLRARGLVLNEELAQDLRFLPDLPYRGYATPDDDQESDLGEFPAMIAAIRNAAGEIVGLHRTYLDPRDPRKLIPPGDRNRNKAKKAFGKVGGGAIWLGPVRPSILLAEGIETALSFWALGFGDKAATPVAAYSLGNLTGSATGPVPHPKIKGVTVPNGVPDMEKPGIILPPEVTDVLLIGDGDSEPVATRAKLLTGMARFKAEGRNALIAMAPQGADFNDILLQHLSELAA